MDEHYFSKKPTSKRDLRRIDFTLNGENFVFFTSSGIFSKKSIDKGTELLVKNMKVKPGEKVLDLGCGYGVVGIIASRVKDTWIKMVDLNKRAVKLSRKNLKINRITNASVTQGDLYEKFEGGKFSTIICNLPMSAGLEVVYRIIDLAPGYLEEDGRFQVVVRKGNKRIEERMQKIFGNVKTLAKRSGYRVFSSYKKG